MLKYQYEIFRKKSLSLCLDLLMTTAWEAMEVAAGAVPLDLRLCEIAIQSRDKVPLYFKTNTAELNYIYQHYVRFAFKINSQDKIVSLSYLHACKTRGQ